MRKTCLLFLVIPIIWIVSCSREQLDEQVLVCEELISYDDVRSTINLTCAYSGCHDGITNIENFNSYSGIEPYLENGQFASRVINIGDMPPSNAVLGPDSLTQEQIHLFRCWEQNDFAEF